MVPAQGKGQGHTTKDFGELIGKRNADSGAGQRTSDIGSGGRATGNGGNGVVMIRYFIKPVTKYDSLLNAFVNKPGVGSFTETELTATDSFLKSLRENESLFNKLVWIYPYIGNTSLARGLNLLNTNTYQITFSGQITHHSLYTRYDQGMGKINTNAGLQTNTDMMLALYVRNSVQLSCYDIAQEESPTNRQNLEICWPSYGSTRLEMYLQDVCLHQHEHIINLLLVMHIIQ